MLAIPLVALLVAFSAADPTCQVAGRVTSSDLPLPGVALVVSDGTAEVAVSSTDLDGAYRITLPAPGRYALKAGLAGFADASHDLELAAESCTKQLDFTLGLRSRTAAAPPVPAGPTPTTPPPGRTPPAAGAAARFRDLSLVPGSPGGAAGEEPAAPGEAGTGSPLAVPAGFSTEAPTDAVTSTGGPIEIADGGFFRDRMEMLEAAGGDLEMVARRLSMGLGPEGGAGGFPGGGFPGGGFPGGGFGGGRFFPGGFGGGGDRLQGNVSHTIGGSALDAAPYRLNGREAQKADYTQQRASANLSGPLRLPGVYDGRGKTRFTLSYSGSWDHRPYDAYSTVPTDAERAGDLSGRGRTLYDPQTGLPFPGDTIPDSRIAPGARTLLEFIPHPNLPGDVQNFHYVTAIRNRTDTVSLQLNHRFGAAARPRSRPEGGRPEDRPPTEGTRPRQRTPPGSGGAGRRGAMVLGQRAPTLNASFSYNRFASRSAGRFPSLGAENTNSSFNGTASFSFSKGRASHQTRVNLSRNRNDGLNLYAFVRDVAGEAGIPGVARDPFDWGIPNVSLTTFADLNDRNPASSVNRRWQIGHSVSYPWKKHNLRLGAELRGQGLDSQTDTNARGSFVFTGLYTSAPGSGAGRVGGLDFADFLLGLPQQASVQYGPGRIRFRSHSWNLYLQDDWRVTSKLTVNAGLRYEYTSPFEEADDHLVNLDVPADFSGAAPVLAGQPGPFTGGFPPALVFADKNNLAPRVGLAWRPSSRTTVRTGYGLNYNLGAYSFIAQRLSGQPPFAVSNTSQGTLLAPLTLTAPFVTADPSTVTNSYGVDKHYALGAVHIWNLDVQRDLGQGWNASAGYIGTAGRNLDIQRAPNRDRTGLRIPNVQAFLWQSSEGESITHALSLRLRKRLARGSSLGLSYTLARSRDNASSLGGGGMVVAQNDRDLDAEWGRSSFDRRHRLALDCFWELPFGAGRRWAQKGRWAAILGGWTWTANGNLESGPPFTARVRGDFLDVAGGVNGTLRADYSGGSIGSDQPSLDRWFNTAAFVVPPPGRFGNAGRNTITGPGTALVNMSLTRNVSLGRPRTLQLRVQANNVFNTPQFGAIDTVVNSPTFGQVISVRAMRTVQIETRLRF